jgi:hypothetical protein
MEYNYIEIRSRIVCTTGTSLQVLHIGGGGVILHVVCKVLPVPSGGAGLLSIRRVMRGSCIISAVLTPAVCAVSDCRACLCGVTSM